MQLSGSSVSVLAYSAYPVGLTSPTCLLPAWACRQESLPVWSMSKPLWPWCLIEPTRCPRAVSSAMTFSTSVVLPAFW